MLQTLLRRLFKLLLGLLLASALVVLALRWLELADWIPTRLLALSFALAGNFTATWEVIRERLLKPVQRGIQCNGSHAATLAHCLFIATVWRLIALPRWCGMLASLDHAP